MNTATLKSDLPASLVVTLVAIPLCLGIALASGAPLVSGLVAGVVGGIIVGSISGSPLMVSGPAAGLTAIVLQSVTSLGSWKIFVAAVVIAGALQIGMSVVRAGVLAQYVPTSVIIGMLTSIGLLLIIKQIPHAVGYDADVEGDDEFLQRNAENSFTALAHMFSRLQTGAILVTGVGLAVLMLWEWAPLKKQKILPGALAAILAGVALNAVFAQWLPDWVIGSTHLVQIPAVQELRQTLTLPDFSSFLSFPVIKVAVTLALVASLETLLSLEATDKLDPLKRTSSANRELLAQGVGNMASGLLGGLPVTGVIVRSAANIEAGGRTRLSAILHGMLLLLTVLVVPHWLSLIPLASLAAVLLQLGYKLARPALFVSSWKKGTQFFVPFIATIVAVLLTDLLIGVLVGLAAGIYFILSEHVQSPGLIPAGPKGSVLQRYVLSEQVTFLQKAPIAKALEQFKSGDRVEIDARQTRRIDPDVLHLLGEFARNASEKQIDLRLVGLSLPAFDGSASH